jgi:hypothetical protein
MGSLLLVTHSVFTDYRGNVAFAIPNVTLLMRKLRRAKELSHDCKPVLLPAEAKTPDLTLAS